MDEKGNVVGLGFPALVCKNVRDRTVVGRLTAGICQLDSRGWKEAHEGDHARLLVL